MPIRREGPPKAAFKPKPIELKPSLSAPLAEALKAGGGMSLEKLEKLGESKFEGLGGKAGLGMGTALPEGLFDLSPESNANMALMATTPPDPSSPYTQWVDDVRGKLEEKGLPTSAEGVRVRVIDTGRTHGHSCTRAVAGPNGFGRGADIGFSTPLKPLELPDGYQVTEGEPGHIVQREFRFDRFVTGKANLDETVTVMGDFSKNVLYLRRKELQRVRNEAKERGDPVTLVNMSWSTPIVVEVQNVMPRLKELPDESPVKKEIEQLLNDAGIPKEDKPARGRFVFRMLCERLEDFRQTDPAYVAAANQLNEDLHAARDDGVLVFASAGNSMDLQEHAGDARFCENELHGIDGAILVGANDLEGKAAGFSGTGQISTVGVDVPCGEIETLGIPSLAGPIAQMLKNMDQPTIRNKAVSGTSFSGPNAVGIASLMAKANPDLSAHDLAKLLDGAGQMDPVALIEQAAKA
jgi:hypothetical protein